MAAIASRAAGDAGAMEIGRLQNRVVSRAQLRAVGLSDRQIDRRQSDGLLHPLYRAVFLVGPPPPTMSSLATATGRAGPAGC